jgi:hypothetical protein
MHRKNIPHRLLPKRLAAPVVPILRKIEEIRSAKKEYRDKDM